MNTNNYNQGDFTGLAKNYSEYRPRYGLSVLDAVIAYTKKAPSEIDFVDVGAGTGIWTRMISERGLKSVRAIEPNDDMLNMGKKDSKNHSIDWLKGTGEKTNLPDDCCDLVSMASSFHWTDFSKSVPEFNRILRPGGVFVALWNPRHIEANPLLVTIENELTKIKGSTIERVSSGRSGITETLTERLWDCDIFDDVIYVEGRHKQNFSKDQYLGVWNSVNDLRSQLGEQKFHRFIEFVRQKINDDQIIEATYITRAWIARTKK